MTLPFFPRWFQQRWKWVCSLCLLSIGLWSGVGLPAIAVVPEVDLANATSRLQAIADELQFVRFCSRATCMFKDIEVNVSPAPGQSPTGVSYVATIDAIMDRPSTMVDRAHYLFEFKDGSWELLGGEELSDVSSFVFNRDRYELFSSYSPRTRTASLDSADSTLRVGYRDLYYLLMEEGRERLAQ